MTALSRSALDVYGQALAVGAARLDVRFDDDGPAVPLPLDRYLAPAGPTDLALLSDVHGPVLDIGCGPGRHLRALTARGVFALGIDLSPEAVAIACRGGARAVVADVFADVPVAGRWRSALLLDENVGIGGSPVRLLARARELICPGGEVIVELGPPGAGAAVARARFERAGNVSHWFPWARVGSGDVAAVAGAAGLHVEARWELSGRWFARLRG